MDDVKIKAWLSELADVCNKHGLYFCADDRSGGWEGFLSYHVLLNRKVSYIEGEDNKEFNSTYFEECFEENR